MDQIDLVILIDTKDLIGLIDLNDLIDLVDHKEQLQGELKKDRKDSDWGFATESCLCWIVALYDCAQTTRSKKARVR